MGSASIAPLFLNSIQDEGDWSASRLGYFTPEERGPDTHFKGVLVGPRAGLDAVKKIILPLPGIKPRPCGT
jgi:hypothetical protein